MATSIWMSTGKKATVFKPPRRRADAEGEPLAPPLPETYFLTDY